MSKETSAKRVVVNSIIYSASGILLKCFSFFLLPLYTAYLTTADYGITSVVSSFTSTMSFIVALSLYSAIMRFYVDLKSDADKLKRFYGTVSLFTFLSGIAWLGVFYLFRDFISEKFFSGIPFFPIIFVALVELVFTCQVTIFDDILKSQQKAMKSSLISMICFFTKIVLNIMFVVWFRMGALGTILSIVIIDVLYTLYFIVDLTIHDQISFCLDMTLLREALKYSVPIIPHNLSTRIALLVSKVLISGTDSLASLGVYTVATQFGDLADTLQGYVDKAYQPWLYEKLSHGENNYKMSIRQTVKMLISVLGLLFLGISLFAQDYIILFVNKSYWDAWKYIPLIVLVYTVKTAYYFYVEVLFYNKKASRVLFLATLTGSVINVGLSYFLIPLYSVYGSILADAIAMIIRVAIVVIIANKYEDVGLHLLDFVLNFFVIFSFILLGLLPSIVSNYETFRISYFLFKCVVVCGYIALVFAMYRKQLMPIIKHILVKQKDIGK